MYYVCMCVKTVMSIWKFPVITNYNPHFTLNHPFASFHKNSAHVKCLYIASSLAPNGKGYTPWNQQQKALKIDGWNTILSFWEAYFQWRAVSFWEGTPYIWGLFFPAVAKVDANVASAWHQNLAGKKKTPNRRRCGVRLLRPSCNNR